MARAFLREREDVNARGENLLTAALCVSLLTAAHESNEQGGEWRTLPRLF